MPFPSEYYITLFGESFEVREEQFVSRLSTEAEANVLLEKTIHHGSYSPAYQAFIAESRQEAGKFRVVLSGVPLIAQLLNRYYPIENKNKYSSVRPWDYSDNPFIVSINVPTHAYIYHGVYTEQEDISAYLKMLGSEPFSLVINSHSHKSHTQHDIVSTMSHPFYQGLLELNAQCEQVTNMIDEFKLASDLDDVIAAEQLTSIQAEMYRMMAEIQTRYPQAKLSYIEDKFNTFLANYYSERGMPQKAIKAFILLHSINFPENQKKLEQLILAYHTENPETPEKQMKFLQTLTKALASVAEPDDSLKNLFIRCCYPLLHGEPMPLNGNLNISVFWDKYSGEELTTSILNTHPEMLLLLIKYAVRKKDSPSSFIKAIDLLTAIPSPTEQSRELLMECLTSFFIVTNKIDPPRIMGSKIDYLNTFSNLVNALGEKQNPYNGPAVSSSRAFFSHSSYGLRVPVEKQETYVMDTYRETVKQLNTEQQELDKGP